MNLYLVRHAEAEPISSPNSDFDRKLTTKGKDTIKKAAEGWKKVIKSIDVIAASPFIRALQTAEIIASVFNYEEKIYSDKKIKSGSRLEDLIEIVKSFKKENILIVGHEPDMSHHVSALVSSSGMFVDFKKGGIAKISFEGKVKESKGTLEFFIPVELFK